MLCKLEVTALALHAAAVVATLEDPVPYVRLAGLVALGKLLPETLAQHAVAVIAKLKDANARVSKAALELLGKLGLEVLKITMTKPSQETRTGMQLSVASNGVTFVEALDKGGLAFAAGIRVGYTVLAANGVAVEDHKQGEWIVLAA